MPEATISIVLSLAEKAMQANAAEEAAVKAFAPFDVAMIEWRKTEGPYDKAAEEREKYRCGYFDAYDALSDAVDCTDKPVADLTETWPQTLAEVAAKARVAIAVGYEAQELYESVLEDIVRVAGV